MIARSLKTRILIAFFLIILILSLLIGLLGFYVINEDIIERAQEQVENDLKAARFFYNAEIEKIQKELKLATLNQDLNDIEKKLDLDYLKIINAEDINNVSSEIAKKALKKGRGIGGTRLIDLEQLKRLSPEDVNRVKIKIKDTPRTKPTEKQILDQAMAKEYALPYNDNGKVKKLLIGGRIINRDYELVDRIRKLVFGTETYNSKPVGTVTIFQGDTRIATNVLNEQGQRAIGTRVSEEVYNKVIKQEKMWKDRAFVVTDWYKTAYEPIKNINGEVVGILYVGILEQPFNDMARQILLLFVAIILIAALGAFVLSIVLANAISKPLTEILDATRKLSGGELGYSINESLGVTELDKLARSFNEMSSKLQQRDESLKISNEKLKAMNKSYVELISFVAHELKGILASAIMNAYAVKDGFLGMVNFKQAKAIDSVTRNLEYLSATVKKFLNLGRIERGDLEVNKSRIKLREDIFERSLDSLEAIRKREDIKVKNNIEKDFEINADQDLLLIVANNLLSNALKYGEQGGEIILNNETEDGKVKVEVYNDSKPISEEQKQKLFKKFSRLSSPETRKVKGSGLGLYITKQIVEKHGGEIWVEPKEKGNSFIFTLERGE